MTAVGLLVYAQERFTKAKALAKLVEPEYWNGVKNYRYLVLFHAMFEGEIDESYPVTVPKLSDVVKQLTNGPDPDLLGTLAPADWSADVYDLNTGIKLEWSRTLKINLQRPKDEEVPSVVEA